MSLLSEMEWFWDWSWYPPVLWVLGVSRILKWKAWAKFGSRCIDLELRGSPFQLKHVRRACEKVEFEH
jgi:hypothetical protein